jgi:hypothetical protein
MKGHFLFLSRWCTVVAPWVIDPAASSANSPSYTTQFVRALKGHPRQNAPTRRRLDRKGRFSHKSLRHNVKRTRKHAAPSRFSRAPISANTKMGLFTFLDGPPPASFLVTHGCKLSFTIAEYIDKCRLLIGWKDPTSNQNNGRERPFLRTVSAFQVEQRAYSLFLYPFQENQKANRDCRIRYNGLRSFRRAVHFRTRTSHRKPPPDFINPYHQLARQRLRKGKSRTRRTFPPEHSNSLVFPSVQSSLRRRNSTTLRAHPPHTHAQQRTHPS